MKGFPPLENLTARRWWWLLGEVKKPLGATIPIFGRGQGAQGPSRCSLLVDGLSTVDPQASPRWPFFWWFTLRRWSGLSIVSTLHSCEH